MFIMSVLTLTQVRPLLGLISIDLAPNWQPIADWQLRLCRPALHLLSLFAITIFCLFHFCSFFGLFII